MARKIKIRNPRVVSEKLVLNKIRHPKLNFGQVTRLWTMLVPINGGEDVKKEGYSQVVMRDLYSECKKIVDRYNATD